MMGSDVTFTPISIRNKLNIPLTHYSTAVTLKVNNKFKSYLIDLTYSQFFADGFVLDNSEIGNLNHDNKNQEQKDFENELRNKGFILLTEENLKFYVNNFLELSNINSRLIINARLKEFKKFLETEGILIQEKHLSFKKELITQFRDDIIEIIRTDQNTEGLQEDSKTL